MDTKKRQCCFPNSSQNVQPHYFYLYQWQRSNRVCVCYLVYRFTIALAFLAMLICSVLGIGSSDPKFEHHDAKWFIYLTNWSLLTYLIQAWLAVIVVWRGRQITWSESDGNVPVVPKKNRLQSVYWVSYSTATVYSFVVTLMYWTFIYNPAVHTIDAINVMVHALNSILMLIDFVIVRHPVRLSHAFWTTGIGLIYIGFSILYYLLGGTNRMNESSIYSILDWQQPSKTAIVCFLVMFLVLVIHCICYCLSHLRMWFHAQCCPLSSINTQESTDRRETTGACV